MSFDKWICVGRVTLVNVDRRLAFWEISFVKDDVGKVMWVSRDHMHKVVLLFRRCYSQVFENVN